VRSDTFTKIMRAEGRRNRRHKEREVVSVLNGLRDIGRGEEMLTELIPVFLRACFVCMLLAVRVPSGIQSGVQGSEQMTGRPPTSNAYPTDPY
jgi:hypothetical protein